MGAKHTLGLADVSPDLAAIAVSFEPVGSRVTCNPPPEGTDADVLVLVPGERINEARGILGDAGFVQAGSQIADEHNCINESGRFESFKLGDVNIILTASGEFYRRFMAASDCAKRLNLLVKADRIALFQAVLYGNSTPEALIFAEAAQ